jgi:hypothetical protein
LEAKTDDMTLDFDDSGGIERNEKDREVEIIN